MSSMTLRRIRAWLESGEADEPGSCFIVSPESARELIERLPPERGTAAAAQEAAEVAERMLRDPQFRYDLLAHLDKEGPVPMTQVALAAAMFEIGVEKDQVWIWIHGLKTFGVGDTFVEAYHDVLDEIGYALRELWAARDKANASKEEQG
jgi:hypothetical protein